MGDKSRIEWTDATWNPVTGCTEISAGCDNCYARTIATRFAGSPAYPNGFDVTLRPDRLNQPLHWMRPRRVFVNSMSDLFHRDVPDDFIAEVLAVVALSTQHTFQLLTKRPGRMRSLFRSGAFQRRVEELASSRIGRIANIEWPLRNLWVGVSVENQEWAAVRIPLLQDTPAVVRFLSCEPLLGRVDLRTGIYADPTASVGGALRGTSIYGIDWVIVGGESGPHARPMHPEWARLLRDQCVSAGVPFLFKQWGEWRWAREADDHAYEVEHGDQFAQPWLSLDVDGTLHDGTPTDTSATVQKVGKKAAGRELDGQVWDQYPAMDKNPQTWDEQERGQ